MATEDSYYGAHSGSHYYEEHLTYGNSSSSYYSAPPYHEQTSQCYSSGEYFQEYSSVPYGESTHPHHHYAYSDEGPSPGSYGSHINSPGDASSASGVSKRGGPKVSPLLPGSNKKERRRTQSINNAFASLRDCIPNVPCDTKLSKIKTLRLATSYIDYLINILNSENSDKILLEGFKVDIHKKWNEKSEEQKRMELEDELTHGGTGSRGSSNKLPKGVGVNGGGGRTGWPQHVWALELK
eukprot:TRINITY_DN14642_c0_g1_i1.p1 TRINITY_DN14642_c0_g1~~TRINITY_DN14642_c0_g1_i1.p1  ORF type:complete len:253 (+),score=85.80 TRINITY_DN14642_c0_g1_i1:45-761(+)